MILRLLLALTLVLAGPAGAETLTKITSRTTENATIVSFDFDGAPVKPKVFRLEGPVRIILDFDGTSSSAPRNISFSSKTISSAKVVVTDDRTRVVLYASGIRQAMQVVEQGNTIRLALVDQDGASPGAPIVENSRSAEELMVLAKRVLDANGDAEDAIESLNAILLMPPNAKSMEAQELIGLAQERAGKYDKAKAEYKFYLTQYPDSPDFKRIQQKLISLEIAAPPPKADRFEAKQPHKGTDTKTTASVSEYYYAGSSSPSLTSIHQNESSLITNGRLTGNYRFDEYTTKIAIRYSRTDNLENPALNRSNLSNAQIDFQDTFRDYSIRLGRQNSIDGVLGRFDGAVVSYALNDMVKVIALGGTPYIGESQTKRSFIGLASRYIGHNFSGGAYVNFGKADGIAERKAIGGDLHYSNGGLSLTTIVEYDLLYKALNTFMLQGNWTTGVTNPYWLIDKRKAPVLFAERATVLGFGTADRKPFDSVGSLFTLSGLSAQDIYQYINKSTPMSTMMVLGTSTPLSKRWTLGTDIQVSNIAPVDIGIMPLLDLPQASLKQPGTGNNYALNGILYGQDIFAPGNSFTGILGLTRDKTSRSISLTAVDSFKLGNTTFEILGRAFSRQQPEFRTMIITVSARMNYHFTESTALDAALSITRTSISDAIMTSGSLTYNQTFYIGVRTDF